MRRDADGHEAGDRLESRIAERAAIRPGELALALLNRNDKGGVMNKEKGAIGYILMWLMGVPATLLFLIFILRGCN